MTSGGVGYDHADVEKLARIGELLKLRGLLIAAHEEQIERFDGRLRILHPLSCHVITYDNDCYRKLF